jgi:GxxExxY protein
LGVFYTVYAELGYGFLESVYEEAMFRALLSAGLKVERQVSIPVYFRGEQIASFAADLLVDQKVIVELKAARTLDSSHEAQTLNYLRATEIEIALLLNFGPKPQMRRLIFDNPRKASRGERAATAANA